ncbi:MAG: hypothetical protein JWP91_149 [Fibrobacteres bacterium]|nr:hypothetical protein [Fibrobacterota bacterium]
MKRILAISMLLVAGCLKPDATGPGRNAGERIEDQNLIAGATSSTNWPQEDAGSHHPYLKGVADSLVVLRIYDSTGIPMKVTGKATLYLAGSIPALDTTESTSFPVSNVDSFDVPLEALRRLNSAGKDTVAFSILFESGRNQALITGFYFSSTLKKILRSPFSEKPDLETHLIDPHYAFHGVPDSLLANVRLYPEGKVEWCFYIPGSPFFFKASPDTAITIGPLPNGRFPIRLLRLAQSDGGTNRMEVYEVKMNYGPQDATHHTPYRIIEAGTRLFVFDTMSAISIRSNSL